MFEGFMVGAWEVGTIVAALSGFVGFFVVVRGRSFPAHAIPNGAFAGAAGATLVGIDPLVGLVSFSALTAVGISTLTRRTRSDVATALWLVSMLALGSAFLSLSTNYESSLSQLLFGEILGVSPARVLVTAIVAVVASVALVAMYRPLMLSSVVPELAEAKGWRGPRIELAFLLVLGLSAALSVPVAGALLTFSLMTAPAATACALAKTPRVAVVGSVVVAMLVIWAAIASSYLYGWPIGFFVGSYGLLAYLIARALRVMTQRVRRAVPRQ